eukprot:1632098-Prymnesium_polylepis.2
MASAHTGTLTVVTFVVQSDATGSNDYLAIPSVRPTDSDDNEVPPGPAPGRQLVSTSTHSLFCGSTGPEGVEVLMGDIISWYSDDGVNAAGWKICILASLPPQPSAPSPPTSPPWSPPPPHPPDVPPDHSCQFITVAGATKHAKSKRHLLLRRTVKSLFSVGCLGRI